MDAFKRKLKTRIAWLAAAGLVIAITYFTLLLWGDRLPFFPGGIPPFHKEFATGAFIGLAMVVLAHILKTASYLGSDERIKALYIKENDERKCLIMQKTGSLGFRISAVGLGFAAVIAGFFDLTVCISLLGAILFLLIVKLCLWMYYERRY